MYEQSVTESGMVKVEGIVVIEQSENMCEQLITEFPSVNVSGISVIFEQPSNISEQLVTEFPSVNVSGIVVKLEHM